MKRRIIILVLTLAIFGGLTWLVLALRHPAEPVYKGKRLSYWVQSWDAHGRAVAVTNHTWHGPTTNDAARALRQIGTNAFPTLLRMLQEKDPALKIKLVALLQKQHVVKIYPVSAVSRNIQASAAFNLLNELGFDLGPVVPELIKIIEKYISPSSIACTVGALPRLGRAAEQAVPALEHGLTNADEHIRLSCLSALEGILRDQPDLAVPYLTKAVGDPSPLVSSQAILKLMRHRQAAEDAIPALIQAVTNSDRTVRLNSVWVLSTIGRDQPELLVPVMIKAARDADFEVRRAACCGLQFFDTASEPVKSALIQARNDPDARVGAAADSALRRIDPDTANSLPPLRGTNK